MIVSTRATPPVSIALAVFAFLLSINVFGAIFGGIFLGVGLPHWAPMVAVITGWAPIIWLMFFKWPIPYIILPSRYPASYFCICLVALPMVVGSMTFICFEVQALLPSFPNVTRALFSNSLLGPMGGTWPQTIARVVVLVLVVPVCEELFFRGFLLSLCKKRWGVTRALLLTSLLFAVLHSDWPGHLLYGLVWGGITLYTGSVFWAIVSHMLLNAITVAGTFILANQSYFHDLSLFASNCGQFSTVGAICIAVSSTVAAYLILSARSNEKSLSR